MNSKFASETDRMLKSQY